MCCQRNARGDRLNVAEWIVIVIVSIQAIVILGSRNSLTDPLTHLTVQHVSLGIWMMMEEVRKIEKKSYFWCQTHIDCNFHAIVLIICANLIHTLLHERSLASRLPTGEFIQNVVGRRLIACGQTGFRA